MSEPSSIATLRVEKPGKSKFVPVVGGERRKTASTTASDAAPLTPIATPAPSPTIPEAAYEDFNGVAEQAFFDVTPEADASPSAGVTGAGRKRNIIETIGARRERRRSVVEEPNLRSIIHTPTAASLVNFTTGGRPRVTMASFLKDCGVGQPMSSGTSNETSQTGKSVRTGTYSSTTASRASQGKALAASQSVSTTVVPQVRIVNGEIVVDEDAAANQNDSSAMPMYPMDVINESGKHLTSHSFVKTIGNNRWSNEETEQFYEALSMCGTDFAIISLLFPKRSREQVKGKFKIEERNNPGRVAMCLKNKRPLDAAWVERARNQREREQV